MTDTLLTRIILLQNSVKSRSRSPAGSGSRSPQPRGYRRSLERDLVGFVHPVLKKKREEMRAVEARSDDPQIAKE